jgi:hypothetical protein
VTERFTLKRVPTFTPERGGTPKDRQIADSLNVTRENFQKLEARLQRAILGNGLVNPDLAPFINYLLKDGSRALTGDWLNGDDYGIKIPWIQLSTTFVDGVVEGRLQWNAEDGTMEYGLPGGTVVLQVGQEIVFKATNKSGVTIPNGGVVYIDGAQGQRPTIALARADSPLTIAVAGMATEEILDNASGYVTATGLVRGVDTSSFSDGDLMYLSPTVAGAIQGGRPTAPNYKVFIGYVTNANATGTVIVNPIIQPTLMALSDVLEALPSDGQILAWSAANNRFELTIPGGGTFPPDDFDLLTNGVDELVFADGDVTWIL